MPRPQVRPLTWEPWVAIAAAAVFTVGSLMVSGVALLAERRLVEVPDSLVLGSLSLWALSAVIGYVGVCLWMQAMRGRLVELGYPGPASWKIWAGWIIPFYALVAPFLVMRELRARVLWGSNAPIAVWWVAFLGSSFVDRAYSALPTVSAASTMMLVVSSVLLLISAAALVHLIVTTSDSLTSR